MKDLMVNPYIWMVLSLLSVFSVGFGVYTWYRGRKRLQISFYQNSYGLISDISHVSPVLRLIYKNKDIANLAITKIAIWNSGNDVINWDKVVKEKPLRIMARNSDSKILDVSIVSCLEETNKFTLTNTEDNEVDIKFDYIDKREGIVVQIIHTGAPFSFYVDCKIKGGEKVKNLNKKIEKITYESKKMRINYMVKCIALSIIVLIIETWFNKIYNVVMELQNNPLMFALVAFIEHHTIILYGVVIIILGHLMYIIIRENSYLEIPSQLSEYVLGASYINRKVDADKDSE